MTAEIAIVNRQAIVLAADSAVTIGSQRVWKHGNKIFSLGLTNDIAVMIYGSGEFAGFPWETVVKTFRGEVGDRQFETAEECGRALLEFLRDSRFSPDKASRNLHLALIVDALEEMKEELSSYESKMEFRKKLQEMCQSTMERYSNVPEIDQSLSYRDFCRTHDHDTAKAYAGEIFEEVMTKPLVEKLSRTLYEQARRQIESNYATGIVVAGYGRVEFFQPSMTIGLTAGMATMSGAGLT